MANISKTMLTDRAILSVSGPDSREFLQGLISNDIEKVSPTKAIYAAFLTPQGKYLFDFFISQVGDELLIDCERARSADFMKRLRLYRLRAKVEVADRSEAFNVIALWGENAAASCDLAPETGAAMPLTDGVIYVDPRLPDAGLRTVISGDNPGIDADDVDITAYDEHRLVLGLPDSSRDLVVDKSILLESGLDDLNGIDWDKGCYMGQEVTARSKYRGLVKKRLVPVNFEGDAPEPGSSIMSGDKNAGEMRSSTNGKGLALMRLEYLESNTPLTSADNPSTILIPDKPDWVSF